MSQIPENYSPADMGPEPDPDFTAPNPDAARDDISARIKRTFGSKDKEEKPRKKKPLPPIPRGGFTPQLEAMYAGIGAMITPFDPVCGNAVMQSAPKCAETLDALARQNDAVRRFLVAMLETSAVGAVIFAHAPIIMTIAMHHSPKAQEYAGKAAANMAEQFAQQNGHNPEPPNE